MLRDNGLTYGDYVEQRTFLVFLKMAEEESKLILDSNLAASKLWQFTAPSGSEPRARGMEISFEKAEANRAAAF